MGDKSLKAKQRDQKQKNAAKASDVVKAQFKQAAYSTTKVPGQKASR